MKEKFECQKSLLNNYHFKSHYCLECKQQKPCGNLTQHTDYQNYCCYCFYQGEAEKTQEYSNYQQVYQQKKQAQQVRIQQFKLLQKYAGCSHCGSKEVDAYELYENNQLVCQPCLAKKTGGSSGPISFIEQSQWYKKWWEINLAEWLTKYQCLPVNVSCAREWLKNKQHLSNCACLELEAKEIYELFTSSLKEAKEKLKKCSCKASEKFRVEYTDSTGSGWTECQDCQKSVRSAGHHGVIKNRNNPKFWGLEVKEKVLCRECLANYQDQMPTNKKYTFNKYLKRGRW